MFLHFSYSDRTEQTGQTNPLYMRLQSPFVVLIPGYMSSFSDMSTELIH